MSKLDELIKKYCPDGVEYATLGDICKIKNGKDYKHLQKGNIPVYGSGGIMTYVNEAVYSNPSVLIPRKGSLNNLFYVTEPFWNVDTIFYTEVYENRINVKFLFYYLQTQHLEELNKAGGVPSLTQTILNKVEIPLPPLPVQEEIVHILDNFTELTAELTARRKQYEFYRDKLLSFDEASVEWVSLKDVAENCDNKRKPVTSTNRKAGEFPYYGASGIVDYVDSFIFDGDYLLVSEDGANLLARKTPIAFSISGKNWVNNHAHILRFEKDYSRKFVEFYLNSIDLSKYISGAAQPKLNQENLNKIPIPFPDDSEQKRIVSLLERFDLICNDITSGLPAEIEARKKQYEYYRDKLLTFERKSV